MALFNNSQPKKKPVVLISMDGVGAAAPGPGNAVTLAQTKNLDGYWPKYPHGMVEASGLYVGLPEGTDGNSEVGHVTMGAGKIILQDLPRIDNAIKTNTFNDNPMLNKALDHVKKHKSKLHVMGIVGDGVVHGSVDHLFSLIKMAVEKKFDPDKFFIHAILDGRDSAPNGGVDVLERLETFCLQKRMGRIVSMVGRAYAMDRNKNWARTKKAYDLMTIGAPNRTNDWMKTLKESYSKKVFDEYFEPTNVLLKDEKEPILVQENDAVIFFNFRPDRAQQITRAFEDENFPGWERTPIKNLFFTGFTDYKGGFPKNVAFPPESITHPLGRIIAEHGLKQLRIAESEKFPHVTYFFNGGNGAVFENEKWLEVPSPDVSTYDLQPEMSQELVTQKLIENIQKDEFEFFVVNFAGPDMVAHTGNIPATIVAMKKCDECVGRIVDEVLKRDGTVVITADHGNAEEMINLQNGEPDTKHSVNQVPVLIIQNGLYPLELPVGNLADIAPTILGVLGIEIPVEMTGRNLLV